MITPSFDFEKSLLPPSCRYLLGVDEVGRGPWAGPITFAAYLLDLSTFNPECFINLQVRDSKLLTHYQRQQIFTSLVSEQNNYSIISVSSQDIDTFGLAKVIENSIFRLINSFSTPVDHVLIDGNYQLKLPRPSTSVVSGDKFCFSIAAASIVAKVTRDQIMVDFAKTYPQYGFEHHKGYGTYFHRQTLKQFGPCIIHRHSFKPIKELLLKQL